MSDTVENIFASYASQGTLEDAATWMAKLTRNHPELAGDFINALQAGIAAASKGDRSVIKAVNAGGQQVSTTEEASQRCLELLTLYSKKLRG